MALVTRTRPAAGDEDALDFDLEHSIDEYKERPKDDEPEPPSTLTKMRTSICYQCRTI